MIAPLLLYSVELSTLWILILELFVSMVKEPRQCEIINKYKILVILNRETMTVINANASKEEKMDRRKRRSRAAIQDSFIKLLEEKPLDKITVTEIAKNADIDRKTFYLHYDSIDALVDERLHEEMERVADHLVNIPSNADGTFDVNEMFSLLGQEFIANFDESAALIAHVDMEKLIRKLTPIMSQTIVEKDSFGLAETLGPHLDLFVGFFCSGLMNIYHSWLSQDSELPMEDLAILTSSAITGGVAALTETASNMKLNG